MSKAKRRPTPKPSFWRAHQGNILTVAVMAVLVVVGFGAVSAWHGGSAAALNDGATNAIGSQVSANPSETDLVGIQAAEQGTLNEPALVWFHADW
jgi:hypothetical protein